MDILHEYDKNLTHVIDKINNTQSNNIEQAANLIAQTVQHEGLIYSFGSGHSFAGALEIAGRAGGYINSKAINSFSGLHGILEVVPGVGKTFARHIDFRPEDCFFIISNSARNPLHLEIAECAKQAGVKIVLVTDANTAKVAKQVNDAGENLYQLADVIIDNCGFPGDCSLTLEGTDIAVGPTSSLSVGYILNKVILMSYQKCLDAGITPPVFMSANVDGGREYNMGLQEQYKARLHKL